MVYDRTNGFQNANIGAVPFPRSFIAIGTFLFYLSRFYKNWFTITINMELMSNLIKWIKHDYHDKIYEEIEENYYTVRNYNSEILFSHIFHHDIIFYLNLSL